MILLDSAGSNAVSSSSLERPTRRSTPRSTLAGLVPRFYRNRVARKANDAAWEYSYAASSLSGWHPLLEKRYDTMRKWKYRADRLGV